MSLDKSPNHKTNEEEEDLIFPQANFTAIESISQWMSTTYGPVSHDKLIINQSSSEEETVAGEPAVDDYVITDDGASLLESLPMQHPITPVVRRMAGPDRPGETDVEGKDIKDGVTSTLLFAGALAEEATKLIEQGHHPRTIQEGYIEAREIAASEFSKSVVPIDSINPNDIARSVLTGNTLGGETDQWASIAEDAAQMVGCPTEVSFAVRMFSTGSLDDSRLVQGAVLDRSEIANEKMPRSASNASILILGGHEGTGLQKRTLDAEATLDITSSNDVAAFENEYSNERDTVVKQIIEAGADVVLTQEGIDADYQEALAQEGIIGIRGVTPVDLAQVAHATGASILIDPQDIRSSDLGHAGVVEEQQTDPRENRRATRRMVTFRECDNPNSVAVIVRGVRGQLGEQVTIALRKAVDAIATVEGETSQPSGAIPGGGSPELAAAAAIRDAAPTEASKRQIAMLAYADALERIPATLVRNAGLDPLTLLPDLRATRMDNPSIGISLPSGEIRDMVSDGIFDPLGTRLNMLTTATEVIALLLKIDDTIDATSKMQTDSGDAIYDEPAQRHEEYIAENDDTIWN